MSTRSSQRALLLFASTALVGLSAAPALAQGPQATARPDALSEIVVTATRQSETVNKVPLSISAVTQATIDRQGPRTAQDLFRTVPGVGFRITGGDLVPQIAVRGIAATGGPQTTAVYLDDTPLQKRGLVGIPDTGSGTPFPQLFDLERVEVLKGPQGTLYGGSSEGGTIRFITPTPSLTRYSGLVKAEGSVTHAGSPSYDLGVAVGGPIINDKLGFRISIRDRRVGGYIDQVSHVDSSVVNKDSNYVYSDAIRVALRWKPTERLQISPSYYHSSEKTGDGDVYWENIPQQTVPTVSYAADGRTVTTDPAKIAYTLPAHTYGPYNMYGPYKSGQVTNVGDNFQGQIPLKGTSSPNRRTLTVWGLNAEYRFDAFTVNLIYAYNGNDSKGLQDSSYVDTRQTYGFPVVYNLPYYTNNLRYTNVSHTNAEEFRLTSNDEGGSRLSWVAGVYNTRSRQKSTVRTFWNWGDLSQAARGVSGLVWFNGVPPIDAALALSGINTQLVTDAEVAGYGNATFAITSKLKATAGVRYSRITVDYNQVRFGQSAGTLNPIYVAGKNVEKPVTPKVGLSYQIDDQTLAYANAAKGYRPGGVNTPASPVRCGADFANIGISTNPVTYGSDSVWSYEAGMKARVLGSTQVNASVFRIDWDTPQTNITLPICQSSYIINAGKAVSQGFDLEVTSRVTTGLTLVGSVAYTDAHQTESVGLNTPTKPIFVAKGDKLPVPPWSVALSAQYDFDLDLFPAFLRADFQYSSKYQRSAGPGTTTYTPDTYMADSTAIASMRAGVKFKSIQWEMFVNNLTNSKDVLSRVGGRSGCATSACTTFAVYNPNFVATTFRPREIGISARYSF